MNYKFKPLTPNEELLCLKKLKEIINEDNITPYWNRDQKLHDLAYSMADKLIEIKMKNAFPKKEIKIINYNFNTQTPKEANPYSLDAIMGYIIFMKDIFTWSPPKDKEFLPINLEIKYIFEKKKKYIMKALEKSVFNDPSNLKLLYNL